MTLDYRKSHESIGKGQSYEDNFEKLNYRAFIWSWERIVLTEILQRHLNSRNIKYLDFACGTGRILNYLESSVSEPFGVDVSESMLGIARKKIKKSKLIKIDLTRNNIFEGTKFDLISAFRFFLNAQPELRKEALTVLAKLLDKDGYLIFNIHMNHYSATATIMRLYKYFECFGEIGSASLLNRGNILDWEAILKKIKEHNHPLERKVWDVLDRKSRRLLSKKSLNKREKNYIVCKLNQFLSTNAFFLDEELTDINLSKEIFDKIAVYRSDLSKRTEHSLQEINRSIFNALYPHETSEWSTQFNTMSTRQVSEMVRGAGLEIIDTYHAGVLPIVSDTTMIPICIVRGLEFVTSRIKFFRYISQNIIYVCAHTTKKAAHAKID